MVLMKDPFNLKGKTAIVTGGNGGIGKGIARGLASAGCQIVVAGRDEEKTSRTVQEIREEFGIRALGIQADEAKEEEIRVLRLTGIKILKREFCQG
jgi:2-dehydro-3-deoxy-D-gluconate 5-dehydrogenase